MIDRDKARALGISADQLRSTLYTGFGTRQVSTIYETGDNYQVIIEFDPRHRLDRRPARSDPHPRAPPTASSCRSRRSRRWSAQRGRCPSTSSASCRR